MSKQIKNNNNSIYEVSNIYFILIWNNANITNIL